MRMTKMTMRITTTRIRMLCLALLLLVILVGGEFALDLSADTIRTAIIVRVNDTLECPSSLDLFPGTILAEEANRPEDHDHRGIHLIENEIDTSVVTIYNVQSDTVCETRRRKFLGFDQNVTTNSFRIYNVCVKCTEHEDLQYPDLIRRSIQPPFRSVSSTRRLRSLQQGVVNHTDSNIRAGTLNTITFSDRDALPGITIQIQQGNIIVLSSETSDSSCISMENSTQNSEEARQLSSGYNGIGVLVKEKQEPEYGIGVQDKQGPPVDMGVIDTPIINEGPQITTRDHVIEDINPDHVLPVTDSNETTRANVPDAGYDASENRPPLFSIGVGPEEPSSGSQVVTTTQHDDASLFQDRPNDCSLMFDECCSDRDCTSNNNICVSRTCIDEGNPRFTLTWIGDDDLDLYVVTPDGFVLSFENEIDPTTGGRVGEPSAQSGTGFHVENIYFPLRGGPPGRYTYYVRPFTTVGSSDQWTLTVNDENSEIARHDGIRYSDMFVYNRGIFPTAEPVPTLAPILSPPVPGPTAAPAPAPTQAPVKGPTKGPVETGCDTSTDECCATSDCSIAGEICVHRTCIDDGNPRITLQWVGDDDLDLFVETPDGAELSFMNFFDPVSGGRVGEEVDQFGFGYHVENVYFPLEGAPTGIYRFFVRPLTVVEENDAWTVNIVDRGSTVMTQFGVGASDRFFYVREPDAPIVSPPPPTRAPLALPTTVAPVANPAEPPSPIGVPTSPPQTDQDCSVFFDECCVDTDCRTSRDLCVQRTCIRDGNPRFTLSWTGDDDLELFVRTPDGIVIDSMKRFDIFSGGRFESDIDQSGFGRHIESVYFPILGTPIGLYQYGVRSLTTRNNPDSWTLEVFDDSDLVTTEEGTGASTTFAYDRDELFEGPQRPNPSPPRCSPISDECCLDSDCPNSQEVCVQRTCIDEGNPRITLSWIGDDDLDLVVETPEGAIITRDNPFDAASGGRYGEQPVQVEFGFHVESIFFPSSSAPLGTYRYYLRTIATRGVGADIWRIRVYENGVEVEQQVGIGDSREFLYIRLGGEPTMPTPTPPGPTPPTPPGPTPPGPTPPGPGNCVASDECCSNTDCSMPGELCANKNCIVEGNPRFTLTWTGDDDFDLSVTTPWGDEVSFANPTDRISGGEFGGEPVQTVFGDYAENINFPLIDSPLGTYTASVRLTTRRGSPDQWTLRVFDESTQILVRTGTSDSGPIVYEKTGQVSPAPAMPLTPTTERPPVEAPPSDSRPCPHECCSDPDCGAGNLCVQRTCISDGSPRFTLSWTGNDDLNLVTIPPTGSTISFQNPLDVGSGGVFVQDDNQSDFGFHVESISFPLLGGPEGLYSYSVQGSNFQGAEDRWTLRVFVYGQLVAWNTGSGESRIFSYEFGAIQIRPTALPSPVFTQPPVLTQSPIVAPITMPPATSPPSPRPNTPNPDCTANSDCSSGEACVQRTCIREGNPRFTLTWSGNDDIDFFVVTPAGEEISASNVFDVESGGVFGQPGDQNGFGFHVENIYFPLQGGPPGIYTYFIRNSNTQGSPDMWEAVVVVDGNIEAVQSGTGNSPAFTFSFQGQFPTPTPGCSAPSACPVNEVCVDGECVVDGGQPSLAPTPFDSFCNPNIHECCTNADCVAGVEVCTQRTCVDEGNPRFTLSWVGNDDLDLIVLTPVDSVVSALNPVDDASGGIFGEPGDQFEFGRHVENAYFPLNGGPAGVYSYYVRSFLQNGLDDFWTVRVFVNGEEVAITTGRGDSDLLTYDFTGVPQPPPSPTPPTQPPVQPTSAPDLECDIFTEECCSNSDCITGDEICVQRTCIDLGNPRFTLTWTGDDDLDLQVVTPFGKTISFIDPVDEITGGVYGEEGVQFVFDQHVENIFFPRERIPVAGIYEYSVRSFIPRGINDRWTVSVYFNNREVASFSGTGDSDTFTFDLQSDEIIDFPTTAPVDVCSISNDECCNDLDCVVGLEICVQRTCIERGNPRFTLTWTGDDDLDLAVVTPLGSTVAVSNPEDDQTGGIFGEPADQLEFGYHVENIFFPLVGSPGGTYTYFVASFAEVGSPDTWTVTVYVNDVAVSTETGTGTSNFLIFEYRPPTPVPTLPAATGMPTLAPTTPAPTPDPTPDVTPAPIINPSPTPSPVVNEAPTSSPSMGQVGTPAPINQCVVGPDLDKCCVDDDCPISSELCVQRICIAEGNPRFTLTWNGNDDYDLYVQGPIGGVISFTNQLDEDSGGIFGGDGIQQFPGLHVENVFFPAEGGPVGLYTIFIQTFIIFDPADTWRLGIFVDGEEVDFVTGTGDSETITYDFTQGSILDMGIINVCSLDNGDECCDDSDCNGVELCVQRTCINDGDPRVTLTWTGDDDLDLFVVTPAGNEISYYFPRDNLANGRFVESDGQFQYGLHVESIYFLEGAAPYGTYKFYVKTFNKIGVDDDWTIQVYVDGLAVRKESGTMDSTEFEFEYLGVDAISSGARLPQSVSCLTTGECCQETTDCPSPNNSLCLEQNCLAGGPLTFTIFWTSEAALLKLSVISPGYQAIYGSDDPNDWEIYDDELSHIRNLAITDPRFGRYSYSITTGHAEGPFEGEWTLWIHGNSGDLLKEQNGTSVGSALYGFVYEDGM